MQYRILGRTGLRVSEIGCGGAPLGIPHYNEVWDPYAEETVRSVSTPPLNRNACQLPSAST
jgi:aryl-alcohol dehydrogenase-like predicted oxidoreductase